MNIHLRDIQTKDLQEYLYCKHPERAFHKYNGPYFPQATLEELETLVENYRKLLAQGKTTILTDKKLIVDTAQDTLIGEVNWYWRSQETYWMELGIVIFNETYWGKGIGTQALTLWIDEKFREVPQLVRLGITTWSGNTAMLRLAETVGMQKEAVYRNARIVDGIYYDSVSYGILREEWEHRFQK